MGSHFYAGDASCHTSNGGAELFFRSIVAIASPTTRVEKEAIAFVEGRIMPGIGFRDFCPASDLPSVEHLSALAGAVRKLACALASRTLPAVLEADFPTQDRPFQLQWVAWAAAFYEVLAQVEGSAIPSLRLPPLVVRETLQLDIHRLDIRLTHLIKCVPESQREQIEVVAQQLNCARKLEDTPLQVRFLERMAGLQVDVGQTKQAALTYREAAVLASDPANETELLELAATADSIDE